MRAVYPEEMKALDRAAAREGVPSLELMERAGRAVAEQARDMLGLCTGKRVAVVAGKGNNGGDGFVAARYLLSWGAETVLYLLGREEELVGDAAVNCARFKDVGGEVFTPGTVDPAMLLGKADLVIDALFGIGFRGRAEGAFAELVQEMNKAAAPVLSVDVPSGVDAGTGAVDGPAVEATRTVTFAWPKVGLYLYPGAEKVGELVVVDIGIPPHLLDREVRSRVHVLERGEVARKLPRRSRHAHKGICGKVLVVAGSKGLTGAAALCARAALRGGAGVVTLGIPESLNAVMEVKLTEVMTLPLPDDGYGSPAEEAAERVLADMEYYDILALGPGLGRREGAVRLVQALLENAVRPVVLDADGINAAALERESLQGRKDPTVITPHPGELGRLLEKGAGEVQSTRLESAREAAEAYRCLVVLKGANTLIAEPGGDVYINPLMLPALATAGSGDVLTGCIAALWAQGLSALDAAVCGVYLHGEAAVIAAGIVGPVGMTAGDVVSHLPLAWAGLLREGDKGGG